MDVEAGSLVFSDAGRDKGGLFVVLDLCGDYCFIADGKGRKAEKPKKKKIKHVKSAGEISVNLKAKIDSGEKPTNTEIRKTLKEFTDNRL